MDDIPKIAVFIEANTTGNRDFLLGISKFSRLHGPWVFYFSPPSYLGARKHTEFLNKFKTDISGIIACDTAKISEQFSARIPIAIVRTVGKPPSMTLKNTIEVIPNDEAIGKMAAEHLMGCGFKQYAYCGYRSLFWSEKRCTAFTNTIVPTGQNVYTFKLKSKVSPSGKEFVILCDWLNSLPKPIAVFCCNDYRSRNIIEACKTCGLSVPEQVAILGVDNSQLICEMSQSPLSSINLNTNIAGYRTAELLEKLMANNGSNRRQYSVIVEPTNVVRRQSTDIFAISDAETAETIKFIRRNANKPINVEHAVDATSLSRKTLENRFKKYLGRTIYQEIKRYRTDLIANLLIETDFSISKIAISLGFPDVNHISRYFYSQKGMTPKEFRSKFANIQ